MPRVTGRVAAVFAAVGLALWVSGLAIGITLAQIPGFVVFFAGVLVAIAPATIWAMGRYSILDSMEKYRRWMDSAPKREPPVG
jgi:hypothetical protein